MTLGKLLYYALNFDMTTGKRRKETKIRKYEMSNEGNLSGLSTFWKFLKACQPKFDS